MPSPAATCMARSMTRCACAWHFAHPALPGGQNEAHGFRVLTFDCYGTLIDWESGIYRRAAAAARACRPMLAARCSAGGVRPARIARRKPKRLAWSIRTCWPTVHRRLAEEWNVRPSDEDHGFGASVPGWPAFPDSRRGARLSEAALSARDPLQRRSRRVRRQQPAAGRRHSTRSTPRRISAPTSRIRRNFQYMLERLAETGARNGRNPAHRAEPVSRSCAGEKVRARQRPGSIGVTIRPAGARRCRCRKAPRTISGFLRCRRWRTRTAVRAAPHSA